MRSLLSFLFLEKGGGSSLSDLNDALLILCALEIFL